MKTEHMSETYSYEETVKMAKRMAKELIATHIERKLSADNIQPKSEIWYFAQSLKTSVNEDHS